MKNGISNRESHRKIGQEVKLGDSKVFLPVIFGSAG
jgi:hypothetical protein